MNSMYRTVSSMGRKQSLGHWTWIKKERRISRCTFNSRHLSNGSFLHALFSWRVKKNFSSIIYDYSWVSRWSRGSFWGQGQMAMSKGPFLNKDTQEIMKDNAFSLVFAQKMMHLGKKSRSIKKTFHLFKLQN